jgi:hypothetical protein
MSDCYLRTVLSAHTLNHPCPVKVAFDEATRRRPENCHAQAEGASIGKRTMIISSGSIWDFKPNKFVKSSVWPIFDHRCAREDGRRGRQGANPATDTYSDPVDVRFRG